MDRGAFFGSIQATLAHLLWGDSLWMSRFDGWEAPKMGIADSPSFAPDWQDLVARRRIADARILRWAKAVTDAELAGDLSFHSRSLGRDVTQPMGACVAHFFNHQTHHRGQVHAMLTSAGARPEDTDLFLMPEDA